MTQYNTDRQTYIEIFCMNPKHALQSMKEKDLSDSIHTTVELTCPVCGMKVKMIIE